MMKRCRQFDNIKLVSFDLDDTLWDIDPVIQKAEQVLYGWLKKNLPRITEVCSPDHIRERRAGFAELHPEFKVDVTVMRKESLKSLFAEFDYGENRVEDAFSVFYKARSDVSLYPDAQRVLENIASHYKLAAITNGNADLDIIGIGHLFSDIQRATMSMAPKPDSGIFLEAAQVLDIDPVDILHVGDNPVADVLGGKSAGVKTVWFNQKKSEWPENLAQADHEVSQLSDLLNLLPKCLGIDHVGS